MKISASPHIPIARQDVSRTSRRDLPVEIERARPSLEIGPEQSLIKYQEKQQKAIDIYLSTAAIDAGKGDGDLVGVDVFA